MNHLSNKHINWGDYARTLAVMAVVLLHVSSFYVKNIYVTQANVWWSSSNLHTFNWWVANLFDSSVRWCIPAFVMLSGALLLNPNKRETLRQFYRKRMHRILIPLIFWVIVYSFINVFYYHQSVSKAWHLVVIGKPFYQMWYLYMLLGLYLITPFLRNLIQRFSSRTVTIMACCALLLAILWNLFVYIPIERPGYFIFWCLKYVGYFLLGYQLSLLTIKKLHVSIPILCLILSILVTAVGTFMALPTHGPNVRFYLYGYLSPSVVIMSLSAFVLFLKMGSNKNWNYCMRNLSMYTLGIYLIHPALIIVVESFYAFFWAQSALLIPLMAIIVYTLSYFVIAVCKKIPWLRLAVG